MPIKTAKEHEVPISMCGQMCGNPLSEFRIDIGDAGFTIHCVPALHFSSRGIYDRNRTLWCGYVIECQSRLVYFAGDTAFGPHFAQIRETFGSPHLALLPIGAYEPRWFMSPVHMSPDEAVRAHEILAARTSVASEETMLIVAESR